MAVRLGLPISHVSVRLHLVKGRPWSMIEHGILASIRESDNTAVSIAETGALPHRLVIESLIRLMKAGWVELSETRTGISFRASMAGRRVVDLEELPRVATPFTRIGRFVIEEFTGACFPARAMKIYLPSRIDEFSRAGNVLKLERPAVPASGSQFDAMHALTEEDEEIKGFDDIGIRVSPRYALLTVRGTEIFDLPPNAPEALREAILKAVKLDPKGATAVVDPLPQPRGPYGLDVDTDIDEPLDDIFVVGGNAHRSAIRSALRQAKEWIVIHSTFLNNEAFRILASDIVAACDRGVRVDILWGQSQNSPSRGQTLREIRQLVGTLQSSSGSAAPINISHFSTGSHAKVVLYDSDDSSMTALLGSCNWLSTQYGSLEVSVRLRDPRIVSVLAGAVAELARPASGHWSPLSRDLAGHAVNLQRLNQRSRATGTGQTFKARVISSSSLNDLVLRARDVAGHRVVFGSHRINANAQSLALEPMRAALGRSDVSVVMHVGQIEPDITDLEQFVRLHAGDQPLGRISMQQSPAHRMHAKFLYWDDDDIVITSQNPLSADPGGRLPLAELGVYISGGGIAARFHDLLQNALQ